MSNVKATPDDLVKVLNEELQQYAKEVNETIGYCGEEVAQMAVQRLKETSPRRKGRSGGKYANSWSVEKGQGFMGSQTFVVYNKKYYRLTHLLEYGHVASNGTRRVLGYVDARPHIADVERWVREEYPHMIEQKLGGR